MSDPWKIAAFYHFTDLPDYDAWAERMVGHGLTVGLCGTLIFAPEGVNSTCAGSPPTRQRAQINTLREFR